MKNIFVGNLDFGATEASVRSWFEEYGTVDRVSIVTDRDTGRSRGFAFVEMASEAEAQKAQQIAAEKARLAEEAKKNCIVSRALASVPIRLDAIPSGSPAESWGL